MGKIKNTWGYRVLAFDDKNGTWLEVHEVYYKNDVPVSYSESAAKVCGSNIVEIQECLNLISKTVLILGSKIPRNKIW